MLFFTRIKLVTSVLVCVRTIACSKWRKLDYKLDDSCLHENLAIHFSNSFSTEQKKSEFKEIDILHSDDVTRHQLNE